LAERNFRMGDRLESLPRCAQVRTKYVKKNNVVCGVSLSS
jgi:hypothetical protein